MSESLKGTDTVGNGLVLGMDSPIDSCNCERSGPGCKGQNRSCQPTWCPVCDRNKVKRRCQSEGLYQEGDPLKELNWCCDRGCDLLNRSSKYSQIKKTELELNEKKINYSGDNDLEGGDNCYGLHRKHYSKFPKEKLEPDGSNQLQTSGCDLTPSTEVTKSQRNHDTSPERCKSSTDHQKHSKVLKYPSSGDYHDKTLSCTHSSEREKALKEMREIYIKEMEILRSKLNLLKDGMAGDGKRMRQRSESEPGFTELPGGVPKRARDNSPKMKMACRKLPMSPNLHHSLQKLSVKQSVPFQRESKSLSPSSIEHLEKKESHILELARERLSAMRNIKELTLNEYEEDPNDSICEENKVETEVNSDDDNESLTSNSSTASSDSNTPIKVGECLGSITLSEVPQSDLKESKCNNEEPEPVPNCKESSQKLSDETEVFRTSLFPNVPPYVKFFMHDLKGPTLPFDIRRHLKWKLSSITPIIIRKTLLNSGFKLVRKSNDWTGQWGKHMKSFVFKTLKDFQKLNHFPGTFQIGRKDRLWKNMYRLMVKFGKKEFGFIPKTYILPHDRKLLRTAWEKAAGPGKGQWIIKPPAAARGTGIKVVHRWGQIPKKRSLIVQKYIAQPYLINGSKFDLRLYVLMTSIHPLRIYLYDDGLVRFASVKYSDDVECLSNRFMHLTNYSINKLSTQYQVNADASSCHGHKWSLKSLWTYLSNQGVNVKALRKNLTDLVIKTIISGESNINMLSKNNLPSRYCSYELFGIDVLLDHTLKPWLLEVNISPSLHSASPLDLAVKGPLVKELLNIAGFQVPAKLTKEQEDIFLNAYELQDDTHTFCYDKRLYWTNLSKEEKAKQESFHNSTRDEYMNTILEKLTPDDVRHLVQFEDELTQLCRFEKIFPTSHTHSYHHFFEAPRYYNMLLDAWETKFYKNRNDGIQILSSLCHEKFHLNVPSNAKSSPSQNELNRLPEAENEVKDGKDESEEEPSEYEKGETEVPESPPRYPSPPLPRSAVIRAMLSKSKGSKAAVVSKPMGFSTNLPSRRPRTPVTGLKSSPASVKEDTGLTETQVPLNETCIKVLAEMRQNGLKFGSDSKQEKMKQFANCKLENSIINESLTNGKNVLSPSKHIHNACIKMNTSS
ncbi:hypothetical protein RUM44_010376 [Polyplax serrata]|uniref:Tubulin polyglutamylase TTLL4 n=1 Tax=Polyplax serrata TaxID=468196 RepID=A0ABR1AVC3_POLSC